MRTAILTFGLAICASSLCAAHEGGQRSSVMHLEMSQAGKAPFRGGDNLELHESQAAAAAGGGRRVTVLDVQHWPWVLVRTPLGESWVNFDRVYSAKHAAVEK